MLCMIHNQYSNYLIIMDDLFSELGFNMLSDPPITKDENAGYCVKLEHDTKCENTNIENTNIILFLSKHRKSSTKFWDIVNNNTLVCNCKYKLMIIRYTSKSYRKVLFGDEYYNDINLVHPIYYDVYYPYGIMNGTWCDVFKLGSKIQTAYPKYIESNITTKKNI
jgi:hypothetical protein